MTKFAITRFAKLIARHEKPDDAAKPVSPRSAAVAATAKRVTSAPAASPRSFAHLRPAPLSVPQVDVPAVPRTDPARRTAARILAAAAAANGQEPAKMWHDPIADRAAPEAVDDPQALGKRILAAGEKANGQ